MNVCVCVCMCLPCYLCICRHLLSGRHVMSNQWSIISDTDMYSEAARRLLQLVPASCTAAEQLYLDSVVTPGSPTSSRTSSPSSLDRRSSPSIARPLSGEECVIPFAWPSVGVWCAIVVVVCGRVFVDVLAGVHVVRLVCVSAGFRTCRQSSRFFQQTCEPESFPFLFLWSSTSR